MEMLHISKADFDRIGADYKGVYMDYQGVFPKRKGRRVAFLPGHGTTLYTEGIHFIVKLISSAVVSYTSSGFTASARNMRRKTILHIWSAWKPVLETLRCLTAIQSTRRGLNPPAVWR